MNRYSANFRFFILWALTIMGMTACDTAKNVEDPDLHYFVKYYGGDGNQSAVDILALDDGSFLLLGNYAESTIDSDIYLICVNAEGNVLWEKRFSDNNNSTAKDLEPTNDGNFIVLADYQSTDSLANGKLLKVSPEGTVLDVVFFGSLANDFSRTVTAIDDGGFIVSGTTELTSTWTDPNNPNPDLGNFFNYRFDQNLGELSTSDWGPVTPGFGGLQDVSVRTLQTQGVFYVFGYSNNDISNSNPNANLGLFYFGRDSDGDAIGVSYPGDPGHVLHEKTEINFAQAVAPELGTGFVVIGTSQDNLGVVSEIFFARMRSVLTFSNTPLQDDITLYKTIRLNRKIRGVSAASSLAGSVGYLVLGDEVRGTGAFNIWISKIDQSGTILWSSTFGSEEGDDSAAGVVELPDGKIVILGTMGLADNQFKMALIKLNPGGQLLK